LIGQKDGEPMRGLEFRKKTEFIGKSKRQIGFWNRKTPPVFSQLQFCK